jgi:hypothetical protein
MATFKIKNYTTEVKVEQTAAEIEGVLLAFGASRIMKEFENGWLTGIRFILKVEWGEMPVALPANVDGVQKALTKECQDSPRSPPLNDARRMKIKEQAERTAWRLMLDWCRVQLSLIRCKQAEPAQVFMPFAVMGESGGKPVTMFQLFRNDQMKALPGHGESAAG